MKKLYIRPIIVIENLFKKDVLLSSTPTEPTTVINPEGTIANDGGSSNIDLG